MTLLVIGPWLTVTPPDAPADAMVLWSTADLLRLCRLHARRPATDQSMPDDAWYSFLTVAQPEVYSELFSRLPDLGYGDPVAMFSDDGGLTYTFGFDAANEDARPMGHVELYENLRCIPDDPLSEGDDYIAEGDRVRMLSNASRRFDGGAGPYARLILTPDIPISAAYEPLLYPKPARMLLVWKALQHWAARPGSGVDPLYYAAQFDKLLATIFLEAATAYNRGGGRQRSYSSVELLNRERYGAR